MEEVVFRFFGFAGYKPGGIQHLCVDYRCGNDSSLQANWQDQVNKKRPGINCAWAFLCF